MMTEPKFMIEGYAYIDDKTEQWCIKEDAPEWAKKEFDEYFKLLKKEDDDNGVITDF